MHRSRWAQIVIDCNETPDRLDAAATFWSAAFGWPTRPMTDPADATYRQLATPAGSPNVLLQAVSHASRVHLDIETTDVEAEVQRLERLGARRIVAVRTWWVMEAPTGHRFCVLRPQTDDLETQGKSWP